MWDKWDMENYDLWRTQRIKLLIENSPISIQLQVLYYQSGALLKLYNI
jgi:hypothetical protein